MSRSTKARFALIHEDATLPNVATAESAGYDLYLCQDELLGPGSVTLLRTGIVAKPPPGYHFELCLRSSVPVKCPGLVLANGIGVIDADYCGAEDEIKIPVLNTDSAT